MDVDLHLRREQTDRHATVNITFRQLLWRVVTNGQTDIHTELYTFSLTDCLTFPCCHGDQGDQGSSRDLCPSSPYHWAASSSVSPAAETKNRNRRRDVTSDTRIAMTSLIKESPD